MLEPPCRNWDAPVSCLYISPSSALQKARMARRHGAAKSGVIPTEFYLRRTTYWRKDGSPSEALTACGEIDPDHRGQRLLSQYEMRNGVGGRQMPSYRVCFMNE